MTARIVCFGELLLQSPRLEVHFGGVEANVAASLAVLGHDSALVTNIDWTCI